MLVKFLSIFATLLPARYRGHFLSDGNLDLHHGAILSACFQFVICGAVLWIRYPAFLRARVAEFMAATGVTDKTASAFLEYSAGVFSVFEYMFNPLSLVLVYFMLEGGVRIFASVANSEVLPTLPLQVIAWLHEYGGARYQERSMGERVVDVVLPGVAGKYDLRIESCRPKQWNVSTTIGWNDDFFVLDREVKGQPPRPFVYLLKHRPEGKVIRGMHYYDPEDVLQKPGWAPVSGPQATAATGAPPTSTKDPITR